MGQTRDNQGLTTHDEDDLHWSELLHLESTSLNDSIAELPNKDKAVEQDGHSLCDVGQCAKLVGVSHRELYDGDVGSDHVREFGAD